MNLCDFNPFCCKNKDATNSSEMPKYNENSKISIQILNEIKGTALILEEG